ncbi:hypothetical protein OPT61_g533 [Boeremia exigua]|uniref:Uncharacterized protein n=1 Tax=Boeremia exigua TaxID=749465 RepID=A0ACC2ITF8_9PLEO|nr:hypothetical protein OPT61_g533 [Boeremia exigua]
MKISSEFVFISVTSLANAQASGTATVRLAQASGAPNQLASAFIYGIPDNGTSVSNQIPESFYRDIGFQSTRAGGAQLEAPNRGWAWGEYPGRFESSLSNYRTARAFGADFILLPHDLWGADGLNQNNVKYPGDDGDWSNYEKFLDTLFADMKSNNMVEGVVYDIWNEPDIQGFWPRPWSQYLELWSRTHKKLHLDFPEMITSGPSTSSPPRQSDQNANQWLDHIVATNTIPNIWSWHNLYGGYVPEQSASEFSAMRRARNLPSLPIDVNEYATPEEQRPSASAWYISQFERTNIRALRANWASYGELHNFMANLLGRNQDGSYYPNGEYQVYKYYNSMRDTRVATSGSADGKFDVFATRGSTRDSVKILAGSRLTTDEYDITIEDMNAVGLPESGSVTIQTLRFDWAGQFGQVDQPVNLGSYTHQYSGNKLTFWVRPATTSTAYAFEFK